MSGFKMVICYHAIRRYGYLIKISLQRRRVSRSPPPTLSERSSVGQSSWLISSVAGVRVLPFRFAWFKGSPSRHSRCMKASLKEGVFLRVEKEHKNLVIITLVTNEQMFYNANTDRHMVVMAFSVRHVI